MIIFCSLYPEMVFQRFYCVCVLHSPTRLSTQLAAKPVPPGPEARVMPRPAEGWVFPGIMSLPNRSPVFAQILS